MKAKNIDVAGIESKVYLIRGKKVILSHDFASLYQVETKYLNQQVRRNAYRFPPDFMFLLTSQEHANLKLQFATSSLGHGGQRKPPLAFTEQGVAMLSSVLNSRRAIEVNIAIMRAFVEIREVLNSNQELKKLITGLETKYDGKFAVVFDAIRELMSSHAVPRKRVIGLRPR